MTGEIITTWADEGPGLVPEPAVRALVEKAEAVVAPLVDRIVGTSDADILKAQNGAGESALGNLIPEWWTSSRPPPSPSGMRWKTASCG